MKYYLQSMKRIIILLAAVLFFVASSDAQMRGFMRRRVIENKLAAAKQHGAIPDYSDLYYWAAHPDKYDMSDSIPSFLDENTDESVDVFFLHPTTYTKMFPATLPINADINDTAINRKTDEGTILNQASVFNGSGRVYSPRYRQANLKVFFTKNEAENNGALDTAYSDLRNAFLYYLRYHNKGRPIIIASHSQGSVHAIRLMKEFFDGKPLQKQLVAAYIVGWQIKKDEFANIPFGSKPEQTGCVMGWRSFKDGFAEPYLSKEEGNSLCTNPISWKTDFLSTDTMMHQGAIAPFNVLHKHAVSARIDPKTEVLWVKLPDAMEEKLGRMGNYHILDYNLFWMDIRTNVKLRISEWWKTHKEN
jgi:hypothetical protein